MGRPGRVRAPGLGLSSSARIPGVKASPPFPSQPTLCVQGAKAQEKPIVPSSVQTWDMQGDSMSEKKAVTLE